MTPSLRMSPFIRTVAAMTTAGLLLGGAVGGATPVAEPSASDCVRFWPEVRYRNYGYDHVVHLHNGCPVRASCQVSSDVNPVGVWVSVPSKEDADVFTSRGSPAREFTPKVNCHFEV